MKKHETEAQFAARKRKARRIIRKLKKLFPNPQMALNYTNQWELLVAVILSAQCTDKKVNEVTQELFKKYQTLDDYVNADFNEFAEDIRPTGFYRNKARSILAAAQKIKEDYNGTLPRTMEEMRTIPGVARKTANVVLGNAYGVVEGLAVDTHVKRLTNLFGLTDEDTPEKIEEDLMAVVPRKDWFVFTYLLIEYGRQYCPAGAHKKSSHTCPLAAEMGSE